MLEAGQSRAGQGERALPWAVLLLCTVDLRLQGRGGGSVSQPLAPQSWGPRESREILSVCVGEVGGHLREEPVSSQSVKEKYRPKFTDFRKSTWCSWEY